MDNPKLIVELKNRGLVEHTSAPLEKILGEKRTVYLGVDPSSDSMQAGNLVVILLMKRLSDAGHKIMLLVGGGTGMIGDPRESGERSLSDVKVIAKNKKAIRAQMQKIIGKKVRVVDNADWLLKIKLIDFLRDIGKHFTVNELTKRDIIKRRLETPNESISYTEFAYSLLQGFDFLTLFQKYHCDLQIGATDQWTNILSGVELIRRRLGREAFALTCPLVTDASGKKFGKSEGNAIWLDAKKTSPFDFYQFWINQSDDKVEKYLNMYTFLSLDEISALMELHKRNPAVRQAQKTLAREVTILVHGKTVTEEVERKTQIQFGNTKLAELSSDDLSAFKSIQFNPEAQTSVLSATAEGFEISKSEARRLMEGGGIRVNDEVIKTDRLIKDFDFNGQVVMIQKGKTAKIIIKK